MSVERNGISRRWVWLLFFAVVGLAELRIAFRRVMEGDSYAAGDWLINYSGGFVRRGLPGETVLWLAARLHVELLRMVFALQGICLVVYLGVTWKLVARGGRGFARAAMILSPATVVFEMLNPEEGLRKEVLLFAVLALLAEAEFVKRMRAVYLSLLLTCACVLLVLSHESLAIYLPYLFAALWLRRRDVVWVFVAPAIGAIAAMIAVVLHPGDANVAEAICRSVGGTWTGLGPRICGGSIAWLEVSPANAHWQTMTQVRSLHFVRIYAALGVLAMLPAVVVWWTRRWDLKLVGVCVVVSMVGSAALFYSGMDWGRWIHIHAVCLMLVLLVDSAREEVVPARGWTRVWGLVVGVYACCWILPVTILSPAWPKFGIAGAILRAFGT